MASLTVRNVDDDLKSRLRVQAAKNGRSMEAEAREIIRESVMRDQSAPRREESAADFFEEIRRRYPADEDDVDFDLMDYIPPREPPREPPSFD